MNLCIDVPANPGAGLPEEPKGRPGQDCWLLQTPCQGCHHPTTACCIAGPGEYREWQCNEWCKICVQQTPLPMDDFASLAKSGAAMSRCDPGQCCMFNQHCLRICKSGVNPVHPTFGSLHLEELPGRPWLRCSLCPWLPRRWRRGHYWLI